jgi:hypothetical protein
VVGVESNGVEDEHNNPGPSLRSQSPGREEKRIPFAVLLAPIGVVFRRVKVFPNAHWVDVLVFLVPPAIHHFQQSRIAVETFQLGVWDYIRLLFKLLGGQETAFGLWGSWQGSIRSWDEVCWRC